VAGALQFNRYPLGGPDMYRRPVSCSLSAAASIVVCLLLVGCARSDSSSAFTPPLDSLLAAGLVDTTANLRIDSVTAQPVHDIYRRWTAFLDAGQGNPGRACQRTDQWLAKEQSQWQCFAVALLYVPASATFEVLRIAREGDSDVYRLLTLFRSDSTRSPLRSSIAVMTVFAVTTDTGWAFANALPRFTSSWRREEIGPITYVTAPGYPFDPGRARRAVAFTDSLATAFSVPPLDSLTYFLLPTVDDVYRIMGLQTPLGWGPRGGVTQPMNRMLFSGDPSIGEEYRHELAHIVLSPISRSSLTFISEGVPTWLGGTSGMDFSTAADSLAVFLRSNPNVTLDSVVEHRYPVATKYTAGAVFVAMVFDRGGINAVKDLYGISRAASDMRSSMERLFQQPWPVIAEAWRMRALSPVPANSPLAPRN
jgi:hypothetical protein